MRATRTTPKDPGQPVVLLTPEQAADALGIGRWKLHDLLRQGRLRSLRIGSCRRIPTAALSEFIAELEREQTGLR
jgi:excisionase family DNA binding protein